MVHYEVQLGFPEELFDVQMCVGRLTQVGSALMNLLENHAWCVVCVSVSRQDLIQISLQRAFPPLGASFDEKSDGTASFFAHAHAVCLRRRPTLVSDTPNLACVARDRAT